LQEWTAWRTESVRRRVYYVLGKKRDKLHLLKGLKRILLDIDKAIAIIRETEEDAEVVVGYDWHGGYGHPDHVALHAPSRTAASLLELPFWEVASHSDVPGEHIDATAQLDRVKAALAHHATQLTVDGDEVVHVGGQRQPIATRFTLRPV